MSTTVERWFGSAFTHLHARLQALHRDGGVLKGDVHVDFAPGIGGVIGRQIARRLGIPRLRGTHALEVSIRAAAGLLHWNRRFEGQCEFPSTFVPVGQFPSGHWVESSGPVKLRLGVSLIDGGWHWRQLGGSLWGMPLPEWLLPRTRAFKRIRNDRYHFDVELFLPLIGAVLSYKGMLTDCTAKPEIRESPLDAARREAL